MPNPPAPNLLDVDPVPTLRKRIATELGESFVSGKPIRISRAPGRLDVMGGIADYTGSLVCEMPLDRAAAVAIQERDDRQIQVFSFNLFDEHKPFTLQMPVDSLAEFSADEIRKEFNEPGRKWAGYLIGCLFLLQENNLIDLRGSKIKGFNIALYSTVPLGAGISSSAAIEVATMINLADHFGVRSKINRMELASMCQAVENRIVGAPAGIMDQVTSCAGEEGTILRLLCQPHELGQPLPIPRGMRVLGINSNVKHSVGGGMYGKTRCSAFMGHAMIVAKMREMGEASGKKLERDPMNGYLANLDPDDYKKYFRSYLPEYMCGAEFIGRFGSTIDKATTVDAETIYHIQHATDHHVLEAMRVRNFAKHMEDAAAESDPNKRGITLDKAGHLMYASHLSYTNDAMLGAPECDLLVDLVKKREKQGLYGAKITGGGSGGTVAILCEVGEKSDIAINEIMVEYAKQSGHKPEAFLGSSDGAWKIGTAVI